MPRGLDPRLEKLQPVPLVQALVIQLLKLRRQMESSQAADSVENSGEPLDTTLFTPVNDTYHSIVHSLLGTDLYPGLSAEELQTFRSDYGLAAYLCNFSILQPITHRLCLGEGTTGSPAALSLQHAEVLLSGLHLQ